MAYPAVISLKQTIHRLLNSSRISIVSSSRGIFEFAYNEVNSLQEVLKRLDDRSSNNNERLNALDRQIREAVHQLEDVIESQLSNKFLSESESHGDLDLEEIRQEIDSFAETVKKMEEENIKELEEEDDDDDDDDFSSYNDFHGKMIGLSDEFTEIKNHLLQSMRADDLGVFSFVGMAGTGRTIAAKAIFEDPHTGLKQAFDCGAWVTVGPKYQFKEILLCILAQIDDLASTDHKLLISEGDEENIAEYLYARLKGRRYMIVLDDIWDTQIWDYLRRSFPEQNNGSLVFLTTSLKEVAVFANSDSIYEITTLDKDKIWEIFCLGIFGRESWPPELEKAGKKIATNCEGRRVALAKVILFLWKVEKTPEF